MINMVPNVKIFGEINFNQANILSNKTNLVNLRKQIGMIFQKGNPFPQSIYDNIAYGPRIHGIKNKKQLNKIVESSLKRSEEHTSELQSRGHLVCRLLLEKKK